MLHPSFILAPQTQTQPSSEQSPNSTTPNRSRSAGLPTPPFKGVDTISPDSENLATAILAAIDSPTEILQQIDRLSSIEQTNILKQLAQKIETTTNLNTPPTPIDSSQQQWQQAVDRIHDRTPQTQTSKQKPDFFQKSRVSFHLALLMGSTSIDFKAENRSH